MIKARALTLFFAGWMLMSGAAGYAKERLEERTFAVQPGTTLKVDTYKGAIVVDVAESDSLRVGVAAISGLADEREADRVLGQLVVVWRETDGVISVTTSNPSDAVRFAWNEAGRIEVEVRVTLPRTCHLDLATGDGSVRLGEIEGNIRVKTGVGTISCRRAGGSVFARSDHGDIVISRGTGDADLATKHGAIRTGTMAGKVVASSVSGDVEIMSARRGLLARANGGSITAGIPKQFEGKSSLETNGGSVTVKIDPAAQLDLRTSSRWGKVRRSAADSAALPLTINAGGFDRRSLEGKWNGGGPLLEVRASGGHIDIVSEAPPFG